MPTIGTMPSLEATQAVGAALLHQFARERFGDQINEELIRQAEDRAYLDGLAATVLEEDESNVTSTSISKDSSTNDASLLSDTIMQLDNTIVGDTSGIHNGSTIQQAGEHFHSMSESVGNATLIQDRTVYHSMSDGAGNRSMSAFDRLQTSPDLASYGRELRRIADEFEKSRLRQTVKDRASKVNVKDITKESFVKLLEELFQEKVTREKIVILFFFCTDVALEAVKSATDLAVKLIGWSFSYIIDTVCSFIHKFGGWDKVLFYINKLGGWDKVLFEKLPSALLSCGAVLAIFSFSLYIKKNLRD